jgi:hypothetical protein
MAGEGAGAGGADGIPPLPLQSHQLLQWQQRLEHYQAPLFEAAGRRGGESPGQTDLFGTVERLSVHNLDPLALAAQPLNFWRWPESQQHGAALYFVLDRPPHLSAPLLLYVGETSRADQRWKGEHDCKSYLAAYGEALQQLGLGSQLSIRFWADAPVELRQRRALEQAFIRHWLPPFNKETRGRWATPFTADLN